MKNLLVLSLFLLSAAAQAKSSACVLYVGTEFSPVTSQYSCDGADLKNLFQASGISAAISKSVPYFLDQGYTLNGCTDSYSNGANGAAGSPYSRCVFIKQ